MNIIQTLILAVIEGLTEFLPVSSTGHMILASALMKIQDDAFVKTFQIFIQAGAVLSIVMIYARRFLRGVTIYLKLLAAFFPTMVVGFIAYEFIKEHLFSPMVVAFSLVLGGIVLILIDEKVDTSRSRTDVLENITYKNAFFIGFIQCLSMIPGVSRAAATIIGGVFNGLDKKQAVEFSFLLAVPTMFAATGYDILKTPVQFSGREFMLLALGFIAAFLSAWAAVKVFLKITENYGFRYFGYYRIVIGVVFLLMMR